MAGGTIRITMGDVASSISLLDNILKIVKEGRKKGSGLELSDVLKAVPSQAYIASGQLFAQIQTLEEKLSGYDTNRTISDIVQDRRLWKNPFYYFAFRNLETELTSISRSISNMVYDLVAVANCVENDEIIPLSFQEAGTIATEVNRIMKNENALLSEIIADLRNTAQSMREEFGTLSQL